MNVAEQLIIKLDSLLNKEDTIKTVSGDIVTYTPIKCKTKHISWDILIYLDDTIIYGLMNEVSPFSINVKGQTMTYTPFYSEYRDTPLATIYLRQGVQKTDINGKDIYS